MIAGPSGLDFDALSQRIHPAASRVAPAGRDDPGLLRRLRPAGRRGRRSARASPSPPAGRGSRRRSPTAEPPSTSPRSPPTRPWPGTGSPASRGPGSTGWWPRRPTCTYQPGKRVMIKVKHERTADCVVGGFRWHKEGGVVGSLLLGLFDDDGRAAPRRGGLGLQRRSPPGVRRRRSSPTGPTPLADHPWTGRGDRAAAVPGGQSRWSAGKDLSWEPLRPELVCRGRLRPSPGRPVPPRHLVRAVATGPPAPAVVHLRPARHPGARPSWPRCSAPPAEPDPSSGLARSEGGHPLGQAGSRKWRQSSAKRSVGPRQRRSATSARTGGSTAGWPAPRRARPPVALVGQPSRPAWSAPRTWRGRPGPSRPTRRALSSIDPVVGEHRRGRRLPQPARPGKPSAESPTRASQSGIEAGHPELLPRRRLVA